MPTDKQLERIVLKDITTKEEYVLYERGEPQYTEFYIGTDKNKCQAVLPRVDGGGKRFKPIQATLTYSGREGGFKIKAKGKKKNAHITRHIQETNNFETIGIKRETLLEDEDSVFLRGYGFFYCEQGEVKGE